MFAAAIVFQMCASPVFAAGDSPSLDEARRLLDEGRVEQSTAILERDLLELAGNADYDYLLGLAWYKSGQKAKAMFAFERVLMVAPSNVDARLKAAQISVGRDDAAYARDLLEPLSARTLDAGQQQELAQIRSAISAASSNKPLAVRGYLLGGIGWDDNVTSGPNQTALLIPGLGPTATALGTATRDKDMAGFAEAGAVMQQAVGEDTWLTGDGSLHQGFNRRRNDVTDSYANLNLGVLERSGGEYFGAALMGQNYRIRNTTYRDTVGGSLNWVHPVGGESLLTTYIQRLDFTYPLSSVDNAARSILGMMYESALGGGGALQCGAYGGREAASSAHSSYRLSGASLGGSTMLGKDIALSAGALYERRNYDAVDALYLYTRKDSAYSFGLAADYQMGERWHLIPRYTHTRNISNMELYDYTRNAFMLQLRWDFDNEKD